MPAEQLAPPTYAQATSGRLNAENAGTHASQNRRPPVARTSSPTQSTASSRYRSARSTYPATASASDEDVTHADLEMLLKKLLDTMWWTAAVLGLVAAGLLTVWFMSNRQATWSVSIPQENPSHAYNYTQAMSSTVSHHAEAWANLTNGEDRFHSAAAAAAPILKTTATPNSTFDLALSIASHYDSEPIHPHAIMASWTKQWEHELNQLTIPELFGIVIESSANFSVLVKVTDVYESALGASYQMLKESYSDYLNEFHGIQTRFLAEQWLQILAEDLKSIYTDIKEVHQVMRNFKHNFFPIAGLSEPCMQYTLPSIDDGLGWDWNCVPHRTSFSSTVNHTFGYLDPPCKSEADKVRRVLTSMQHQLLAIERRFPAMIRPESSLWRIRYSIRKLLPMLDPMSELDVPDSGEDLEALMRHFPSRSELRQLSRTPNSRQKHFQRHVMSTLALSFGTKRFLASLFPLVSDVAAALRAQLDFLEPDVYGLEWCEAWNQTDFYEWNKDGRFKLRHRWVDDSNYWAELPTRFMYREP